MYWPENVTVRQWDRVTKPDRHGCCQQRHKVSETQILCWLIIYLGTKICKKSFRM